MPQVIDTTKLPGHATAKDITSTFNAASLTITTILAYTHGSTVTFQFTLSDGSTHFIKAKNGRIKVNGADNTFDTGTEILWQG